MDDPPYLSFASVDDAALDWLLRGWRGKGCIGCSLGDWDRVWDADEPKRTKDE
ncbi:MAG: hypothetical protein MI924_25810 [Chloroflexales bacterium]|nr:hypothetical protein [Chloroflexales bacterium]